MRDSAMTLDPAVVDDIRSRCSYPAYEKLPHMPDELKQAAHDPLFERWRRNSVFPHKVQGYSIVTVSLKPVGAPPGDATADQMDTLADLADRYSFGEIRVGHEQNLALPHVAKRDLPSLWKALDRIGLLGVEKNGEEFYQITIGGRADENAQMGTLIGPAVPYAEVADVIEDIVEAYLALRDSEGELFVDTVKRLGVEPFKERVYATR